jgi:hypothetical protein
MKERLNEDVVQLKDKMRGSGGRTADAQLMQQGLIIYLTYPI